MSISFVIPMDRRLCPWDFPEKNREWVAIPFPRDLPNPGIKPMSPVLLADSLPLSHLGSASNT